MAGALPTYTHTQLTQPTVAPAPFQMKRKWWVPRDKYKHDLFEKTKKDLNYFLAVSQEGVPFSSFPHEFEEVTGSPVPYRNLGFKSVGEMLFHMDDIVSVRQDNRHGTLFLYVSSAAPIDNEILHIRQLVIAQEMSDKTKSLGSKGLKGLRLNTHDVPIDILLRAKEWQNSPYQRTGFSNGYKSGQNVNRFAPWRDDRPRSVSEAGEPIRSSTDGVTNLMSTLSLVREDEKEQTQIPTSKSVMFTSIPQNYFHAV